MCHPGDPDTETSRPLPDLPLVYLKKLGFFYYCGIPLKSFPPLLCVPLDKQTIQRKCNLLHKEIVRLRMRPRQVASSQPCC